MLSPLPPSINTRPTFTLRMVGVTTMGSRPTPLVLSGWSTRLKVIGTSDHFSG